MTQKRPGTDRAEPRFGLSLTHFLVFLVLLAPVFMTFVGSMPSVDLTYHLRAGASILGGQIPSADAWTFTIPGQPWTDVAWLSQAALAFTYQTSGWVGIALLRALMVGLFLGLVFVACKIRGADDRRAAFLTLGVYILSFLWFVLRPQMFAMDLMALTVVLVVGRRRWPRLIWLVPLVVIAWANVHGTFFLASLILGLAWLEDLHDHVSARQTFVIMVLTVIAPFITPFGISTWLYAISLSTNGTVTSMITEWQPTSLHSFEGIMFFGSALLVMFFLVRRDRATPWPVLASLGIFFLIGVYAIRGLAWWPVIAAVMVAGLLARGEQKESNLPPGSRQINAVFAIVLVIAVIAVIATMPVWRPVDARIGVPSGLLSYAPAGVTAELRTIVRPDDRLDNPQAWGSWFEYALPDLPIAVDSRFDVITPEVWQQQQQVDSGIDGWQQILKDWKVTLVLAQASEKDLVDRLATNGYREIYRDTDGVLFASPDRAP